MVEGDDDGADQLVEGGAFLRRDHYDDRHARVELDLIALGQLLDLDERSVIWRSSGPMENESPRPD